MFFDKFLRSPRKARPMKIKSSVIDHRDIKGSLDDIIQVILESAGNPGDLIISPIKAIEKTAAVIIYLETLVDGNLLGQHVIEPVKKFVREKTGTINPEQMQLQINAAKILLTDDLHHAIDNLLSGYALVIPSDNEKILAVSLLRFAKRAIEEAPTEKVIKGPREGFNETLNDNISMIRRSIKDPNLRLEKKTVKSINAWSK